MRYTEELETNTKLEASGEIPRQSSLSDDDSESVSNKEIGEAKICINSYKIPKVEKPAKLGQPHRKKVKMNRENKVMSKKNTSQASRKKNEVRDHVPQLKGILRKQGHNEKAKRVRWQTPLDKVIWISRNRHFQESWQASFAKKISVSKSIV